MGLLSLIPSKDYYGEDNSVCHAYCRYTSQPPQRTNARLLLSVQDSQS